MLLPSFIIVGKAEVNSVSDDSVVLLKGLGWFIAKESGRDAVESSVSEEEGE